MISPVDELLGMLSDAGVSHECVTANDSIVIVTTRDGSFEITPAKPSPGDDQGVQWHVHRYLFDRLGWAVMHSSAEVVDQVRSALFGEPTPLPEAPERPGMLAGWYRALSSTGAGIGELHRVWPADDGIGGYTTACGMWLFWACAAVDGDPTPICEDCADPPGPDRPGPPAPA